MIRHGCQTGGFIHSVNYRQLSKPTSIQVLFWIVHTADKAVLSHVNPVSNLQLITCSHRQNCLVLSCWRCEHNCRQDKTVLFDLQLCSHQDSCVSSMSAMWTSHYSIIDNSNTQPSTVHKVVLCSIMSIRLGGWFRFLGSQPTGDISHKPSGRLSVLCTRPPVTFPAKEITRPWPVPNYTVWWQRHTVVSSLPKASMPWRPARIEPMTCESQVWCPASSTAVSPILYVNINKSIGAQYNTSILL